MLNNFLSCFNMFKIYNFDFLFRFIAKTHFGRVFRGGRRVVRHFGGLHSADGQSQTMRGGWHKDAQMPIRTF